jgi:hypothetical protein
MVGDYLKQRTSGDGGLADSADITVKPGHKQKEKGNEIKSITRFRTITKHGIAPIFFPDTNFLPVSLI